MKLSRDIINLGITLKKKSSNTDEVVVFLSFIVLLLFPAICKQCRLCLAKEEAPSQCDAPSMSCQSTETFPEAVRVEQETKSCSSPLESTESDPVSLSIIKSNTEQSKQNTVYDPCLELAHTHVLLIVQRQSFSAREGLSPHYSFCGSAAQP